MSDSLTKWRKLGTAEDARRLQWRAVKTAERIMYKAYDRGDEEQALKALTRLNQANQTYLKVLEADELEERIEALEEAVANSAAVRRN